ncbi:creatininase family protein [Mesorhizobium sp. CAU 1732]|uniref:creatininase family protein n=1 Tax=Mesorhizobium sp. CAU 1732 TaxID=3140358 RepID=UPI003260257C
MTASETKPDMRNTIAILPLGATEQHGPHLPFETDSIIAQGVVERAIGRLPQGADVIVLPVETIGYSIEHLDVPGTKSLAFDEAVNRWIGIGEECLRQGISRFVMLNAHGGNSPLMTIVATELRVRHAMLAVATSWTRFGYPLPIVSPEERAIGIHGGFIETSVMLALRPELVDMTKARDFPSAQTEFAQEFTHLRAYGPHAFGWMMSDLNPDGVAGNAAAATAEAGEAMLDHAASGFAELLGDVARFDMARLK